MAHIHYTTGKINVKASYKEIISRMKNYKGPTPFFLELTEIGHGYERELLINVSDIIAVFDNPKKLETVCKIEE